MMKPFIIGINIHGGRQIQYSMTGLRFKLERNGFSHGMPPCSLVLIVS